MNMDFRFGDERDWFLEKRFGLFVHWGIYAIDGWHEQMQYRKAIPRTEYEKLAHQFNPLQFDPDAWLDIAEEAGMQYICFTTKHIDGFCMWDTKQTDYSVMHTPYGRDTLAMLADACHRRSFPLCLYYAPVDNHHPNYPNQGRPYELPGPQAGDEPSLDAYMHFLKEQVKELCTGYGKIHGFWWDTADILGVPDPSLNEMIRALQPAAVINNRGFTAGDFDTPERDWFGYVDEVAAFSKPTEACQSIGVESWGYRRDEDYYTDRHLVQSIDKILAKGGNYLLNVGPMPDGSMPPRGTKVLRSIGRWHTSVKEAFAGTRPVSLVVEKAGSLPERTELLTVKGKTVYVHLYKHPTSDRVLLRPITVLPKTATLLNTGASLETSLDLLPSLSEEGTGYLRLCGLPANELEGTVMVIKLEFDELPALSR
jgi:alpha-L-fucosidase